MISEELQVEDEKEILQPVKTNSNLDPPADITSNDYNLTLESIPLAKQNSSKLPPKGIPLGKSLKVRTQKLVTDENKNSPRGVDSEHLGENEHGVFSDSELARSPTIEQHVTLSQKTENSRKQEYLKAGSKKAISGRESQDFKIKTKRSQSKKNQPTQQVLPLTKLSNLNSLVTATKANKLIILPIPEPPTTNHRGKSATQSIVNLAQNEKNLLNYQVHLQALKQQPMARGAQRLLPPIVLTQGTENDFTSPQNLDRLNNSNDEEEYQEDAPKIDYEQRNLNKLKAVQEARKLELLMIEDQRQKMMRKQEKLKNMILQQAAEYKEQKAKRALERAAEEQQQTKTEIKKKPKQHARSLEQKEQQIAQAYGAQSLLTGTTEPTAEALSDDDQNKEERLQKDMMKKFYRNRYSTFLKAIAAKKAEDEQKAKEKQEKEEKLKRKLQEKVLGQNQIASKVYNTNEAPSDEEVDVFNPILASSSGPSTKMTNIQSSTLAGKTNPRRGSSISLKNQRPLTNSEQQVAQAYNIQLPGKPTSSNKSQRGLQLRSKDNDSQSGNRTLTPKITRSKQMQMPIEPPVQVYDEVKEQEILKEAAERKARAEQIRARNEKQMQKIKDKKEAEENQKKEAELRAKLLRDQARYQVKQQFEQIKNAPSLREQQDSRAKLKRQDEDDDTPKKTTGKQNDAAFQNFIERNIPQNKVFLNITDMATWKKKNRVDDETKVFIIRGGYGDVKRALKQRGWVENKDKESPCFDLKWTLKTKDIDTNTLLDNQIVNHFAKATSITTKVGLTHSLKNLIWFNNIDVDTFYPRCFDLGLPEEADDFISDFKATKAQNYLKIYARELREAFDAGSPLVSATVNKELLQVALDVSMRRVRDLDELIDDPTAFEQIVSDAEWRILGADELTEESLAQKKHENWMRRNQTQIAAKKKKKKKKVQNKKVVQEDNEEEYGIEDEAGEEEENDDADKKEQDIRDKKIMAKVPEFKKIAEVIEQLKSKFPQFQIDGERNVWIVKPAGSSRGRGICLFKNLVEIIDITKQIETQYIVQKYIENTLICKNRKFDIRQWVLVTDWNPLTIWMYAEPYIRFPASDFDLDSLGNRYAHLSNNSVAKYAKQVTTQYTIEGNMWCLQEFQDHLTEEYGYDVWETDIVEKIKSLVINSLESVQDMFDVKRGQQHELFGYDVMIDDDFNCWLIEVNSSPAMDYSTPVTERLVKMVLEDTVKVVVDYAQAPTAKKKAKVDTGLYECIYRATRVVDKPMASFGLNMEVVGKKVKEQNLRHY